MKRSMQLIRRGVSLLTSLALALALIPAASFSNAWADAFIQGGVSEDKIDLSTAKVILTKGGKTFELGKQEVIGEDDSGEGDSVFTWPGHDVEFDNIEVKIGDKVLTGRKFAKDVTSDADFTYVYQKNDSAGKSGENAPRLEIEGQGDYTGTLTQKFFIPKKDLGKDSGDIQVTVTEPESFTYNTGEHKAREIKVTQTDPYTKKTNNVSVSYAGGDGDVALLDNGYKNNVEAGNKATLTIAAQSNTNYTGQKEAHFTINPKPLDTSQATLSISGTDGAVFDYNSHVPTAVVTDSGTKDDGSPYGPITLVENKDYELEYVNSSGYTLDASSDSACRNAGTVTVYLRGKGNYTDPAESTDATSGRVADATKLVQATYTIAPRALTQDMLTITGPESGKMYYSGSAADTTWVVKDGNHTLVRSKTDSPNDASADYYVTYEGNTSPGTAVAHFHFINNYTNGSDRNLDISKSIAVEQASEPALNSTQIAGSGAQRALYQVTKTAGNGIGTATYVRCEVAQSDRSAEVPALVTLSNGAVSKQYRVTKVGDGAFATRPKVKTVVVGDNVEQISNAVFKKAKKLAKLTIGAGVSKIAPKAFKANKKLKTLVVKSTKLASKAAVKGCLKKSKIKKVNVKCVKPFKKKVRKAFKKWGGKKKGVKIK